MPFIDILRRAALLATSAWLAACQQLPQRMPPSPRSEPIPGATLPAPTLHSIDELRQHAARRIVATNPQATYDGVPPNVLLAIPVLEVELHADGSIRRIEVLRYPRQARETTQIAIDAVHRAAPFGDVSRLPRPWKFTETFLFDDNRRFKPRTLN